MTLWMLLVVFCSCEAAVNLRIGYMWDRPLQDRLVIEFAVKQLRDEGILNDTISIE